MSTEKPKSDFSRFQQRREELWSPKIAKAIQQQIQEYIDKFGIKPMPNAILNPAPVYNVVKELYLDAGVKWGAKTAAELTKDKKMLVKGRMPMGLSQFLIDAILRYFEMDLLNDVQDITETTRKDILKALTKAAIDGLGHIDTIKLMMNTGVIEERAKLIARTETVTAANQGAVLAAGQSGLVLTKEWVAADDSRTRHDHSEVNGMVIGEFDSFTVGGYPMQCPGDRGKQGNRTPAKEICNCRCRVVYRGKRDANGRLIKKTPTN